MPVPDLSGVPPWATYDDLMNKINDIVAKYNNLLVNLDSLNVVSLTADHIDAGTIDANVVTIRSDLTGGAYVQIDGNGMAINNGSYNTFTADITGHVTMTSALIQSANGYPLVVMDPNTNLLGAYQNANSYIQMIPLSGDTSSPQFLVHGLSGGLNIFQASTLSHITSSSDLQIQASGDIDLLPGFLSLVSVDFTQFRDLNMGNTLFVQLSTKAESGIQTGSAGPYNGGIPIGTNLMTTTGVVTWNGIPAHTHTQN